MAMHPLVRFTAVAGAAFATGIALLVPAASAATPRPTPAPAPQAAGQQGVSLTPLKHDHYASESGTHLEMGDVTPGVAIHDKVRVLNLGGKPLPIDLYAADAIPALNGGFGFSAESERARDVGSWITLAARHLDLAGHSVTTVPFTLLVPKGVAGGEHVGAIVAEPTTTSGGGVQTKTRFAMAVYMRLPGLPALPHPGHVQTTLTVTKLDVHTTGRKVCPVLRYRNDTPDVIDPSVAMTLTSSFGFGTKRLEVQHLGGTLPGAAASSPLPCFTGAAPGPSTLKVTVTSPQGVQVVHADVGVYPWPLFVALFLLLVVLLLVAREVYKRHRARQRELAELRATVHGSSSH